jgi:hypothetical protein
VPPLLAYCKFAPVGEEMLIEPVGVPQVGCVTLPMADDGVVLIVRTILSDTVNEPVTVVVRVTLPAEISAALGV